MGDKPIDLDGLVLANPVAASLRLEVILRVPVRVVDDDGIGSSQVNAQPSSTRTQQEHKAIRVFREK